MEVRKLVFLLPLLALTGCDNAITRLLFPAYRDNKTDPASVCRATPVYLTAPVTADAQTVVNGYTNGDEGTRVTVALVKSDTRCPASHSAGDVNQYGLCGDASGYQTFSGSGVSPDGVAVTFNPGNIFVTGAQSRGYVLISLRLDQSCHG